MLVADVQLRWENSPMPALATSSTWDAETCLSRERERTEKHEYLLGEVFARGGARQAQILVAGNLYAALKQRPRGSPCRAYVSDMKPRVTAADAFFYPDVMLFCDDRDPAAYRLLPTLRECILVDIEARRFELYRRTDSGDWLLHDGRPPDGVCPIASLELSVPVEEIFEDAPAPE